MSLIIATNVAEASYFHGDYAQALSKFRAVLEIDSTFSIALDRMGETYRKQGMMDKALVCYQKAVVSSRNAAQYVGDMGNCLARMGRTEEANAILKDLLDRYARHKSAAWCIAVVYAGLGEKQKALDWLERDINDHSGWMIYLRYEEAFDTIRSDPRYTQILRRTGLLQEG